RNGDGVIDFVNARLVMGERPTAADVSAAADLAARFGFETMAMNLPVSTLTSSAQPGATVFIVGRDGLQRAGTPAPSAMSSLGPGEGIVSMAVTAAGERQIVVAGADAAG